MSTPVTTRPSTVSRLNRVSGSCLVLGGITFIAGGATHPGDSGEGDKVQQLHEMLVQPSWYPSHALLLLSMGLFAAGIFAISRRDVGRSMAAATKVVAGIGALATVGMAAHLFAALEADSLAAGQPTIISTMQTWNETIIDTLWGLSIAFLAVAGGLTRTVGNRITLALGLAGGLAYALASATIAFTDRFDPLFPVGSLIGIWAAAAGVMAVTRK
ncbi:hypothetical protein AB0B54_13500 [Microbispora bryophytorum]|uniref:hypothetical protein n=1 Tax=Microbispora bryophytorum TaxID=1460882 RepID=UPI003404B515